MGQALQELAESLTGYVFSQELDLPHFLEEAARLIWNNGAVHRGEDVLIRLAAAS